MLSDRESDKEDDGTKNGKSITGTKLKKIQNTLNGISQLNTISKIYLEATECSIKKNATGDYLKLFNYLQSVSFKERKIIMETVQGSTELNDGNYRY